MILELFQVAQISRHLNETVTTSMGGHLKTCDCCGQLQPHELKEIKRKSAPTSSISLDGYSNKYISQCEVCHTQTIHAKGILPNHIERWEPDTSFHEYARRSGHQSADANLSIKSPTSIGSLLRSVAKSPKKASIITLRDYTILVFILLISCLLSISSIEIHRSVFEKEPSDFDIYLGIGTLFGSFLLGIFILMRIKRNCAKPLQQQDLQERMARLGLKPEDILTNMPQALLDKRKIYKLVKPMMHGSH